MLALQGVCEGGKIELLDPVPRDLRSLVAVVFLDVEQEQVEEAREAILLAQSPAFGRLIERGLAEVERGNTRPVRELLDELPVGGWRMEDGRGRRNQIQRAKLVLRSPLSMTKGPGEVSKTQTGELYREVIDMEQTGVTMTMEEIKTLVFRLPPLEFVQLSDEMGERAETFEMMRLAETGFAEWNEPGEDIYNLLPATGHLADES